MKRIIILSLVLTSTAVLAEIPNDVDPFGFEKEAFISSKSRAEVQADLKVAQATGQMPVFGEIGVRPIPSPSVKTRAQVVAETREAARLGLLVNRGELGPRIATPEEERQIELAGLRVVEQQQATAK